MQIARRILGIAAIATTLLCATARAADVADRAKAIESLQKGDYASVLATFRPLAEKGDSFAQFMLGQLSEQGSGVAQSYREAARWYKLAAQGGEANAMTNLGYLYEQGKGVPQDYAEAVKLYK
ncbi:MAG: tetratricopeptide repeat protein, partial [Casimicrobiaceae bacterium]